LQIRALRQADNADNTNIGLNRKFRVLAYHPKSALHTVFFSIFVFVFCSKTISLGDTQKAVEPDS